MTAPFAPVAISTNPSVEEREGLPRNRSALLFAQFVDDALAQFLRPVCSPETFVTRSLCFGCWLPGGQPPFIIQHVVPRQRQRRGLLDQL